VHLVAFAQFERFDTSNTGRCTRGDLRALAAASRKDSPPRTKRYFTARTNINFESPQRGSTRSGSQRSVLRVQLQEQAQNLIVPTFLYATAHPQPSARSPHPRPSPSALTRSPHPQPSALTLTLACVPHSRSSAFGFLWCAVFGIILTSSGLLHGLAIGLILSPNPTEATFWKVTRLDLTRLDSTRLDLTCGPNTSEGFFRLVLSACYPCNLVHALDRISTVTRRLLRSRSRSQILLLVVLASACLLTAIAFLSCLLIDESTFCTAHRHARTHLHCAARCSDQPADASRSSVPPAALIDWCDGRVPLDRRPLTRPSHAYRPSGHARTHHPHARHARRLR
jgi:hypothetical protein